MPSPSAPAATEAALARRQARAILAEGRFHIAPVPRPLHGVLHAIGTVLAAPLEGIEELFNSVALHTPGGSVTLFALLAALVLALASFTAVVRSRRALDEHGEEQVGGVEEVRQSAKELQAAATKAEQEGRYDDAVRLCFRAGIQQLSERELLARASSTPNAAVARALASERFDALATAFDEIVYGGRPALADDAAAARSDWDALLRSLGTGAHDRAAMVASG